MCHVPVDTDGGYMERMHRLYDALVEQNTAAANLTPGEIGAYIGNIHSLFGLMTIAGRAVELVGTSAPLYRENPYIFSALCDVANYNDFASGFANYCNRYNILASKVESLPVPHMYDLDRLRFIYSGLFADHNKTNRPSLIGFTIRRWFSYAVGDNDQLIATPHSVGADDVGTQQILDAIQNLIDIIQSNPNADRLRGLMIKSFGEAVFRHNFTIPKPSGLRIVYSEAVSAQLENAILLGGVGTLDPISLTFENDIGTLRCALSGVLDRSFKVNGYDGNYVVNSDRIDVAKYLKSITRLMPVATIENGAANSDWVITDATGETIIATVVVTKATATTVEKSLSIQAMQYQLQDGSISDANRNLLWWLTRNVNSFPAVIVRRLFLLTTP